MNSLKLSAAVIALVAGISTVQAATISVSDGAVSTDGTSVTKDVGTEVERTVVHPGQTGTASGITATISNIEESDLSGALQTKIHKIRDNRVNITANRRGVAANKSDITSNRHGVATNKSDINDNRRAITSNRYYIRTGILAVATNKADIKTNRHGIAINKSAITTNGRAIVGNKFNITNNRRNISLNTTRIGTNETNIAHNSSNIATNASNISANSSSIVSLEQDVDELRSGVAMAVAIANAPVLQGGKNGISVSGGFGHFKGKAASALKVAYLPTEHMVLTASVATDFNNSITAGAGMGFSF